MGIVVSSEKLGPFRFFDAHIRCDFCGTDSESQSACGIKEDAIGKARAHARVTQRWGEVFVLVTEGRYRYSLSRDKCPACMAKADPDMPAVLSPEFAEVV